jgi:hypothetical protein
MKIVNQRDFQSDQYLKALNIKVDTNEMLEVNGKLIFYFSYVFYFL